MRCLCEHVRHVLSTANTMTRQEEPGIGKTTGVNGGKHLGPRILDHKMNQTMTIGMQTLSCIYLNKN